MQVFQQGKFLEIERLGQSLKALSMEKCYDVEMTSLSKRDLFANVPFSNVARNSESLGEFSVPLQMNTGPAPE